MRFVTLFLTLILLRSSAIGEIIPTDRRTTWAPGVPGGIPTRATIFTNMSASATLAQINSAIAACPSNQVVMLAAGSYVFTDDIIINKSGVTLRGAGAGQTIIKRGGNVPAGENALFLTMGSFPSLPGTTRVLSANANKAAVSATLTSVSSISVGQLVLFSQDNDSDVDVNGDIGACTWCGVSGSTRVVGQYAIVTNISGLVIGFEPPLHKAYPTSGNSQIYLLSAPPVTLSGVESMTFDRTSDGTGTGILINHGNRCWLKSVESKNGGTSHISVNRSLQCEVRLCYVNDVWTQGNGGDGYGIRVENRSTDCLFEDNILYHCRHHFLLESGATGNVLGYNFNTNVYGIGSGPAPWLYSDFVSHSLGPNQNLLEGNVFGRITFDDVWGNGVRNTCWRNWSMRESNPPEFPTGMTAARRAISYDTQHKFGNIVGNVLGKSGQVFDAFETHTTRSDSGRYALTFGFQNDSATSATDTTIFTNTIIHLNWDYSGSGQFRLDSTISDTNVPASLYLSGRPSWMPATHQGVSLPYPSHGPNTTDYIGSPRLGPIPAMHRWNIAGGVGGNVATMTTALAGSGTPAPTITSALTSTGTNGVAYSYQITTDTGADSYGASNLPTGLSINGNTGLISGTPNVGSPPTTNNVTLTATNSGGFTNATLVLTVNATAPVIAVGPVSAPAMAFAGALWSPPDLFTNGIRYLICGVTNVGGSTLSGNATASAPFSITDGSAYSLTAGQSQLVTVGYSPTAVGAHTDVVTFTGGGGATLAVSGIAYPVLTSPFSATNGYITAPFIITNDYIYSTNAELSVVTAGGRAIYGFTLSTPTAITIAATVSATTTASDSLFWQVNSDPTITDIGDMIPLTTGFESRTWNNRGTGTFDAPQFLPYTINLPAGTHELIVYSREANLGIQTITISTTNAVTTLTAPRNLSVIRR